jgi:cyclin C
MCVCKVITKLGRKMLFRQRVIATATVFFRRFYLKNSYSLTDPFTVMAACCYLAAKAEESPIHIKTVVQDSRTIFNRTSLFRACGYTLTSFWSRRRSEWDAVDDG